ncbi:hypothetical protein KAR91_16220 [Candidatus Pacearchaeota archaeon]|nr:hypothetical protein [Candidatus Pacearchaeota archaeon]
MNWYLIVALAIPCMLIVAGIILNSGRVQTRKRVAVQAEPVFYQPQSINETGDIVDMVPVKVKKLNKHY